MLLTERAGPSVFCGLKKRYIHYRAYISYHTIPFGSAQSRRAAGVVSPSSDEMQGMHGVGEDKERPRLRGLPKAYVHMHEIRVQKYNSSSKIRLLQHNSSIIVGIIELHLSCTGLKYEETTTSKLFV